MDFKKKRRVNFFYFFLDISTLSKYTERDRIGEVAVVQERRVFLLTNLSPHEEVEMIARWSAIGGFKASRPDLPRGLLFT